MNIGQEVVMTLKFASPNNGTENVLDYVFSSESTAVLSNRVNLKETPPPEAVELLIAQTFSLNNIHCIVDSTSIKPQVAWAIGSLKKAIMAGWKAKPGGASSSVKPGSYSWKEWKYSDMDIDDMNEDYAQDLAVRKFFEESPFTLKMPKAAKVSDPEDLEGAVNSKFGDSRDGDERDNTQPDSGPLSLTSQGVDFYSTLLGPTPPTPNIPAVADGGFSPLLEGPSEYLHKLSESQLIFNKTVILPNWDSLYSGRYEFWAQGQKKVILNNADRNLSLWDRDDELEWLPLAPTLDYALRNLTVMGSEADLTWSESMFEVPPQDFSVEDEHGSGTWFFRLSTDAVAKVIAETTKLQVIIEQVTDLNTREFFPPPGVAFAYGDNLEYETPEFLYNSDPFDSNAIVEMAADGDGGGGGAGEPATPPDDPYLMLNVKAGDKYVNVVNRVVGWLNEVIADNGPPVAWKLMPADELQNEGLAKDAHKDSLVLIITDPKYLPPNVSVYSGKLAKVTSYPWVSLDGIDLDLNVGGWMSIVKTLKADAETIQAIEFAHHDLNALRSVDQAKGQPPEPGTGASFGSDPEVVMFSKEVSVDDYINWMMKVAKTLVTEDFKTYMSEYFDSHLEKLNPLSVHNHINWKTTSPITQQSTKKHEEPDSVIVKGGDAAINWASTYFQPKVTTLGLPEICSMYEISRVVNLVVADIRGGDDTYSMSGRYKIIGYEHEITPNGGFSTSLELIPAGVEKVPGTATTPGGG
tara:strand:- start:1579 stop:3825 length:2247 start_codon:yes stop_codon:yes gene_type:complete